MSIWPEAAPVTVCDPLPPAIAVTIGVTLPYRSFSSKLKVSGAERSCLPGMNCTDVPYSDRVPLCGAWMTSRLSLPPGPTPAAVATATPGNPLGPERDRYLSEPQGRRLREDLLVDRGRQVIRVVGICIVFVRGLIAEADRRRRRRFIALKQW